MADYGSADGVKALARHIQYGQVNMPTEADLERWLAERSGVLNGWIAAAGYAVPVVVPQAKAALDHYANYGAASDAEAAQRNAGYADDDEDRREVWFASEFRRAEAWITSGALGQLGAPLAPAEPGLDRRAKVGQIVAGSAADPRLRGKGGLR